MRPSDFTWREYRTHTVMNTIFPLFINSGVTHTPTYLHHTSLYGFTEKDAKEQMKMGNTKNRKVSHYSSELVIDTDNEETAEKVWVRCRELDIPFELWKLNNHKFYLKRDENDKASNQMVYQDRQFVRDNFIDCNLNHGLDLGIYSSPFHIMRAKGAIHEVTQKKSLLMDKQIGSNPIKTNDIEVRLLNRTNVETLPSTDISEWTRFQISIDMANGTASNRHFCIFSLGKDLRKILTFTTALEIAIMYARSLDYSEEKTVRALKQAYEVS